jgi:hypothetical protein
MIDERLKKFTPPSDVKAPLSLAEVDTWKAVEHRNFILYYGVPAIRNVLPSKYVEHFTTLSSLMAILLGESITVEKVEECKVLYPSSF